MNEAPETAQETESPFAEVLGKNMQRLIGEYGEARKDLAEACSLQKSHTLGELCDRLKAIQVIICKFEHDHWQSGFLSRDCIRRKINAACGHQGIDSLGYERSINDNNASATMEEAIAFLEALGEDCSEEHQALLSHGSSLSDANLNANGIQPHEEKRRDEAHSSQLYFGQENMHVLASLMKKMTKIIRKIHDGELLPKRSLEGMRYNSMMGTWEPKRSAH